MRCCAECRSTEVPQAGHRKVNVALQGVIEKLDLQIGRVDPLDVELGNLIQRGTSGSVYRGRYRGRDVAVKQLNVQAGWSGLTVQQLREVSILQSLAHPNILQLIGTCNPPEAYIVTPWCAAGDLGAAITGCGPPTTDAACRFASNIAVAMEFIHSRNILHRDLKPANILLCGPFEEAGQLEPACLLSDFGVACPSSDATMTGTVGTPAYCAPEVLCNEPYGKPADVYAFGAVLYEIFAGSPPYSDLASSMQIMMQVARGIRPQVQSSWPMPYPSLIRACFRDSTERPLMTEICEQMTRTTLDPINGDAGSRRVAPEPSEVPASHTFVEQRNAALVLDGAQQSSPAAPESMLRTTEHSVSDATAVSEDGAAQEPPITPRRNCRS